MPCCPRWHQCRAPTLYGCWSCWSCQCDFTTLLLYAFRVPCLTTILDSLSLECENTYTPARRVALFCEHFVARTFSAGCRSWMFFSMKTFIQQILTDILFISFEISLHLSCLLPAVSLSILFTPMQIRFTLKRLLSLECCLELLLLSLLLVRRLLHLRNCRIDPCGGSCYDACRFPSAILGNIFQKN